VFTKKELEGRLYPYSNNSNEGGASLGAGPVLDPTRMKLGVLARSSHKM